MQRKLTIKGMMCSHCEANVKNALEEVYGVGSAEVSHENGTAVVELLKYVDDRELIDAVTAKGYEVTGIE